MATYSKTVKFKIAISIILGCICIVSVVAIIKSYNLGLETNPQPEPKQEIQPIIEEPASDTKFIRQITKNEMTRMAGKSSYNGIVILKTTIESTDYIIFYSNEAMQVFPIKPYIDTLSNRPINPQSLPIR